MFWILAIFGLGWCVGGLCNEWYRRRHPYIAISLIRPTHRARLWPQESTVTNDPIWHDDPSPKPRVRHGD